MVTEYNWLGLENISQCSNNMYYRNSKIDRVEKPSLKNRKEIVKDLNNLLTIVNDGKMGFDCAALRTDSNELKVIFNKHSIERNFYAAELKAPIVGNGGKASLKKGSFLGQLHRVWIS
jgi:hypothetical protein